MSEKPTFYFDGQTQALFGVDRVVMEVKDGPRALLIRNYNSQDLMRRFWTEGGTDFTESLKEGRVSLGEIDWSSDSFELTDRKIAEILDKQKDSVRNARDGLNIGEVIDLKSGIRSYSRDEILRLIVGTHAYVLAIKTLGFRHNSHHVPNYVENDFRRKTPRF